MLNFLFGKRPTRFKDGFDATFYGAFYKDLHHLKGDLHLFQHFEKHGRKEGRFANEADFLAALHRQFPQAEPDFAADEYLEANPDLRRAGIETRWAAQRHYLEHGRGERRPTRRFDPDIYRDLYFADSKRADSGLYDHYQTIGQHQGLVATGKAYLRSRGIYDSGERWINRLKVDEFAQLNYSWAGNVCRKVDAIELMLSTGIGKIAPIAFDALFDVGFYREYNPNLRLEDDAAYYRHWLFEGMETEEPGSGQEYLTRLGIRLTEYPAAFRWQAYACRLSGYSTRWHVLARFVEMGAPDIEAFILEHQCCAPFLRALIKRSAANDPKSVLELTRLLSRHTELSTADRLEIADAFSRLEQFREALKIYLPVLSEDGIAAVTHINAARAALHLKKALAALAIIRASKGKVVGSPEWRKVLDEAIDYEFGLLSAKANELLKLQRRQEADLIVQRAVDRVVKHYAALDPLGTRMPVSGPTKIVMLANVGLRQCTHYRVEQKQRLFEKAGISYEIYPAHEVDDFISALTGATLAIFYRLPAFPPNVRAITVAKAFGIPTFYDIDDLIFDSAFYPEPIETYGNNIAEDFYRSLQFGVPLFRAAMALCDYGIASTSALAHYMRPIVYKHEVFVLPNVLDDRNDFMATTPPQRVRRDQSVVLFYGSGTKAHNSDFLDLAGPGLLQALQRHPEVELVIVGYLSLDERFDEFASRIITVDLLADVNSYWSLLAEADINLAVLVPGPTTNPKSKIKWLEAAVMGIPSVVSATDRYCEVLNHDVDALIAATPKDWIESIDRLVADAPLRKRIGSAAKAKAVSDHSLDSNVAPLRRIVDEASKSIDRRPSPTSRKRLLLINIFFPPQTLGGSTRIVRDNVDSFLDDPSSEFDIAIVTTDFGNEGTGRMRVEEYRGCPVFRISPPILPEMEWWAFHDSVRPTFRRILESWKPDLVHFHCVQRLSASIVYETRKVGIPYIVTIHDAWWVSDWQFMCDVRNRIREPCDRYPVNGPEGVDMGQSIDRLRELKPLLNAASEILAVSRAFAEIYIDCGFSRTRTVENGVPPLKSAVRSKSKSGKVRLAHIGSTTKFKGFFLLEAALRQSFFENLELTVVEHHRYGGDIREMVMGATKVRFVGKTIQEEMHRFYASHDVLLAPSIWPEPYGLVSREAIAAGLWVVASDRGAIGEDVSPGVNGWIIDVSTPKQLIETLSKINANPGRYLSSPPPVQLRTADTQAAELRDIYRSVLGQSVANEKIEFSTVQRTHEGSKNARLFDLRYLAREEERARQAQNAL